MPTIRFCIGGLSAYERAFQALKDADAEFKLIIAGNHDVSLDAEWWARNLVEGEDDPEEPQQALELFRSHNAKEAGLRYLEEGTHTFELKSGVRFTVYASPYTPEFNGYAFAYEHDEDRFNTQANAGEG
ncbi:hypothetical protein LTS18_006460, partial [Coniosporium uncinatum]